MKPLSQRTDPGPGYVGFCLDGHFQGTWQSSYSAPMRMRYVVPEENAKDVTYFTYDPTKSYLEGTSRVTDVQYFWKEINVGGIRRCYWTIKPPEPLNSAQAWIDIIDSLTNLAERLKKGK